MANGRMFRLKWSDIYEFGIPEIDDGHRRIINMFNQVGGCFDSGNFDTALGKVIHLIAIERSHLATENRLLKLHEYSDISAHEKYHRSINKDLNELMESLGDRDYEKAIGFYDELAKDILKDIVEGDLPFKSHLQYHMANR